MAKRKTKPATDSRLFVLALGLLVGFVVAFVFLLSRLPVDGIIQQNSGTRMQGAEMSEMNFDYYAVLQEQEAGRKPEPQPVVAGEPPVVFMEPPREILPESLAPQVVQGSDSSSTQQRHLEPRAAVPEPVPVQPDVQRAQAQAQAEQVPVPLPAQPEVPAQPQIQQPLAIPDAPARAPVREILASERAQDSYYVEAGSYPGNNEALRAQSTLRSIGLEAFIVVRPDAQGTIGHRVRIGPFFDQTRLDATRERLRASGIAAKMIRVKGS